MVAGQLKTEMTTILKWIYLPCCRVLHSALIHDETCYAEALIQRHEQLGLIERIIDMRNNMEQARCFIDTEHCGEVACSIVQPCFSQSRYCKPVFGETIELQRYHLHEY